VRECGALAELCEERRPLRNPGWSSVSITEGATVPALIEATRRTMSSQHSRIRSTRIGWSSNGSRTLYTLPSWIVLSPRSRMSRRRGAKR
jgi:hypothetical protein